jgi:CRP/FNR family transcriptional regulator, nitrogen oxide reductase regulator
LSKLSYLRNVEIFKCLSDQELCHILQCSREQAYKANKFLFYQDDPAHIFYLLLEGHIKLSQLTSEGNQVVLQYLNAGEAFGIVAILRQINFPVSAQVVEDCRVMLWDKETMKQLMVRYPQISLNAIQILSKYILQFQDRIRELTSERVERRIVRALLRLAQQVGRKEDQGVVINLSLTRQDIAEMAGTTLFTVSRTLSKMQAEDLIDWRGEQIWIKAPHELVKIAEDMTA